jgi:hypothetical protein
MPRRLATSTALVLAVLGAVAAAPAAGRVATLPAPPATVKLLDCSRDSQSATFHGRMKRIEGSERMWMRFTVLEKHSAGFEPLAAPGLGRWQKSKPGVAGFSYRQTVRGLQPGASYKMQVRYRWYSAEGELMVRAHYSVRVENTGVAAARDVAVRLSVDGDVLDTPTVGFLRAGESRVLGFRGPPCIGSVTAEVDPDGVLVESSEDDNVQELSCADLP